MRLSHKALAGDDPSLEMYEWQGGYQEVRDGNHYAGTLTEIEG